MALSVTIRDLEYAYPGEAFRLRVPALAVAAGEQVVLTGRSGCGKTTLALLIAGVLPVPRGTITVGESHVHTLPEPARRRFRGRHLGFVFQAYELLDYLTCEENILLPYYVHRELTLDAAARARAAALAEAVGLRPAHLARRPGRLSQGEQQRVALCRALVTRPGLVIADEPTASLDPATAGAAMDLLRVQARAAGATLLVITHDAALRRGFDQELDGDAFAAPAQGAALR